MSIERLLHRHNPWLAADRLERLKSLALVAMLGGIALAGCALLAHALLA